MWKEALKLLWLQIVSYLSEGALDRIKAGFKKALIAFKEALWKEIKQEVHDLATETIDYIQTYFSTEDAHIKKELILDSIMDKLELPWVLKPFKGLIRKLISEKIDKLIKTAIDGFTSHIA